MSSTPLPERAASPGSSRHRLVAAWPVLGFAALTVGLAVTVLQRPHPTASPQIPWVVLTVAFALTELDGFGVPPHRRSLTSSLSRIPLVIGLYCDAPVHLLLAQQVGTAIALSRRLPSAPGDALFKLAGSGLATALGAFTYLLMTGVDAPRGPAGWLDGIVAACVVVLLSGLIAAGRSAPRPRSVISVFRWLRLPLMVDAFAVAVGLVVAEILRTDPYGAWLLLLPAVAVFGVRRQHELADWRADALANLHDVTRRIQRASDIDGALALAVEQARTISRAGLAEALLREADDTIVVCRDEGHGARLHRRAPVPDDELRWRLLEAEPPGVIVASHPRRWRFDRSNLRSRDFVTAGIVEHGILTGSITVTSRMGLRTFSPSEIRVLRTLAASLGPPLETTRFVDDLSDRNERAAELMRQLDLVNQELQRVSDAKTVFLATTSHELRAPLTALLAEAEVLGQLVGGEPDDACRRLVDGVGANARHLLRLVDDLLDLSRIEANRLEVRMEPLDLAEVAEHVVSALRPVAAAGGVDLLLEHTGSLALDGDGARLWQVLANLVENARAATAAGGRITVRVDETRTGPRITVTDTGLGIEPDLLGRIFGSFEQGPSGRQNAGLGLGLTIARHLVERHGGTLTATSTPGIGSSFMVQLGARDHGDRPVAAAAAPARALAEPGR